jgi:AraC-like DNA-binding protein
MERARRLLEDDNIPVSTIAGMLGFSGVAVFSAFFKSHQGSPLTSYREFLNRSLISPTI